MSTLDKRGKIIRAAETLFAAHRFHEVKLDDVARQAGVAKGTIYLYFGSKDDLFVQVLSAGFDEMIEALNDGVPLTAPFRHRLAAACEAVLAFQERRRPMWHLLHQEEGRFAKQRGKLREIWFARRTQLVAAIAEILRQGQREGHVRKDASPELMSACILGALRGRKRIQETMPELDSDLDMILDILLNGICVNASVSESPPAP